MINLLYIFEFGTVLGPEYKANFLSSVLVECVSEEYVPWAEA